MLFKMVQIIVLVSLGFILGLFSCKQNVDLVAEQKRLLETDIAFSKTSIEKGAPEAFFEYLTDDALQLPNGAFPINGREAIFDSMKTGIEITLTWEPQKAEVAKSGDLGYTWGTYQAKWQGGDGTEQTSYGKYLNVWKRQEDGSWKVAIDIGNSSPAP